MSRQPGAFLLWWLLFMVANPSHACPHDMGREIPVSALQGADTATAQAKLEAHAEHAPEDPDISWHLGQAAFLRMDYEAAASHFELAMRSCPEDAATQYWLGRALGEWTRDAALLRQPELARRTLVALRRAVALDGGHARARLALLRYHLGAPRILGGNRAEAQRQVRALTRDDPLLAHRARGLVYRAGRDGEQEYQEYRLARAAFRHDPLPHYWLAEFERDRGEHEAALARYRELARWTPSQPRAWYEFGVTAEQMGRHEAEAIDWLQRYLDEPMAMDAPSPVRAYYLLGKLYLRQAGKDAEARAAFLEALELAPAFAPARTALRGMAAAGLRASQP